MKKQCLKLGNILNTFGLLSGNQIFIFSPHLLQLYAFVMYILKNRNIFTHLFLQFILKSLKNTININDANVNE